MNTIMNISERTKVILAIFFMVVASLFSSCDLTRKPTDSLSKEESLLNFDDAVVFNKGVMAQFRNRQGGNFVSPQEYQADCVNASADFGNRSGLLHGWVELSASDGIFATVYQWYYSTLKNVNFTLEEYPKVIESLNKELGEATSDKEKEDIEDKILGVNLFMGGSYFARAFYYYNLMLRFGAPYKAASAATDLGVPLVLSYDVAARITRNSVKECYEQIFKDLDTAEGMLKYRNPKPGNSEFTVDAVTALRARVYLEMKEYDKAYAQANKLIAKGTYPLVPPTEKAFENMWVYDTSTEDILILYIQKPDELPYGMGSYYALNRTEHYHSPDFYPTQAIIDLYEDNDLRKGYYFYVAPVARISGKDYKSEITLISKFKGNPLYASITDDPVYGAVPNGAHRPKVFRMAEQYLIAAEAAYFSGKDALKPLNALRASRGLDPINSSGEQLLKDIQDERLRELAFEGFRLWDLRRWNLPVKRGAPQDIKTKSDFTDYLAGGYYELDVKPSDKLYLKTTWAIPQREINVYGEENMPQNPGW